MTALKMHARVTVADPFIISIQASRVCLLYCYVLRIKQQYQPSANCINLSNHPHASSYDSKIGLVHIVPGGHPRCGVVVYLPT